MSDMYKQIATIFPGKRFWFLKPRELDKAIMMIEEGIAEETKGRLRLAYSKEEVLRILYRQLKWPINKVLNYVRVADAWSKLSNRAPVIKSNDDMGGEDECDGDCENCDSRDRSRV